MLIKMLLAFGIGLGVALTIYPIAIPFLHKIKFGQSIRELGPQSHMVKSGTPTMGGVVFIFSALVATLIVVPKAWTTIDFLMVVLAFVGYGCIGFIDDFIIVVQKNNKGLPAKQKFLMQSVLAVVFYLLYRNVATNTVLIPFTSIHLDLGWFYIVVVYFMLTGTTNAVNLSDGLDGLSSGLTILALIPYVFFCYKANVMSVAVLLCAVIGGLVGYLRYNLHPAKIFMGDTGSLALGGVLAASAMVSKMELALIVIGGVFIVEVLSVILQVISFKTTGKRIFKMSPIHHHFELSGWPETKVVKVFWLCGLILSVIGLLMGLVK